MFSTNPKQNNAKISDDLIQAAADWWTTRLAINETNVGKKVRYFWDDINDRDKTLEKKIADKFKENFISAIKNDLQDNPASFYELTFNSHGNQWDPCKALKEALYKTMKAPETKSDLDIKAYTIKMRLDATQNKVILEELYLLPNINAVSDEVIYDGNALKKVL